MSNKIKERYTLREAAEITAQGDAAGTEKILLRLKKSVRDGILKVFSPGSEINFDPETENESFAPIESSLIRSDIDPPNGGLTWVDRMYDTQLHEVLYPIPDNLEVYWDDLNRWLNEQESRITYKFPDPKDSIASENKSTKGVQKRQIADAFDGMYFSKNQWSKNLSSSPNWLVACRVSRGVKGNNRVSSLWNPVKIALVLYTDKNISIEKLDAAFKKQALKDWASEWRDETDLWR